jgi:hypothetical protein
MDDTSNTDPAARDHDLDPHQAVHLIEEAAVSARRAFETSSPITAVLVAGVFLFGYGAAWWSMLDEHPDTGPALWSIGVLYGVIVVMAIVGRIVLRRPMAGVGGRARRHVRAAGVAIGSAGVAAWMVQGALRYLGVSFAIVYGVYGPTVPLIALAAASTGFAASRGKWPEVCLAIAVMLIAAGSTFFGPAGAWGLTGVGSALALLVYAVVVKVRLRRAFSS